MVRDIKLNIYGRDLSFKDKSNGSYPVFNAIWGNLVPDDSASDTVYCNILLTEAQSKNIVFDTNHELLIHFSAPYAPIVKGFKVRLVSRIHGQYFIAGDESVKCGFTACSYLMTQDSPEPINASYLPAIDIDFQYTAKLIVNPEAPELNQAYIFSSKNTDIEVGTSDYQSSTLLSMNRKGSYYRYPRLGVGVADYLNTVISHTDLVDVIKEQFSFDGRSVHSVEYNEVTGEINISASPEVAVADTNVAPISELDVEFFNLFTDDYIRRMIVFERVDDRDFLESLDGYGTVIGLYIIPDDKSDFPRVEGTIEDGKFGDGGEVIVSDTNIIVTATLPAASIVMFDDNTPTLYIYNNNNDVIYKSDHDQSYYVNNDCYPCFHLKEGVTIKYSLPRERYSEGRGLRLVNRSDANLQNMVALVQDNITGKILGVIAGKSTIKDVTLNDLTQRIYAHQLK